MGRSETTLEIEAKLRAAADECGVVPRGTFTRLAREYGVRRSWIKAISSRINIVGNRANIRPKMVCICGGVPRSATRLCRNCDQLVLPCEGCGEPVVREVANLVRYPDRRVFCGRGCSGTHLGRTKGWGKNIDRDDTDEAGTGGADRS